MCVMSAVFDGARQVPFDNWNPHNWGQFQEILRRIGELDKALKQPDCEDPAKAAWMREVERRLAALEAQAAEKAKA